MTTFIEDGCPGTTARKKSEQFTEIPMRILYEIIRYEIKEKIDQAEQESNDLEKIEQEKRQFNALQDWSKKPRYQMTETLLERAKLWIRDVFMDTCECGGTYYDWSASKIVCDKCGRVK